MNATSWKFVSAATLLAIAVTGCGGDDQRTEGVTQAAKACVAALAPTDRGDTTADHSAIRAANAANAADKRWNDLNSVITGFVAARAEAFEAANTVSLDTLNSVKALAEDAVRQKGDVARACRKVRDAGGKMPDTSLDDATITVP